ncbi:MAG: DUF342 domain-containing protein [Lachnospiraceae bacterium]|nr:DUF342 domain-containing protein [Candidatus Merdinaster equi]
MNVDTNWCSLKVDNEGIYALMCLNAPTGEDETIISPELVQEFLAAQNIVYGINEIVIESMLENVTYGQYVCVAKGVPAKRGLDGYFKFEKDTQDMKKKPLILEDGSADYKNSLNLATIQEGELLAVYIPPTEGSAGQNVYGKVLPSLGRGKDIMPLRGKGIRVDEEKINYYAEYSGHIVMDGNHISIEKLYRVSGDLDIEVGNIRFDGDVEISGDVRSGFEIDTTGSIFIHGHVGGCKLTAGENITIEKGIQGRDACTIYAKGDVACKFVERCHIEAHGNIYADSILDATVIADERVIVTSRTGNVIGCEVYGKRGVIVKEAGNDAGTPTLIRCGLPREDYARASQLSAEIKEIIDKLDSFNRHLVLLESSKKEPREVAELRTKIMRAKIVLSSKRNKRQEELNALNERISEDGNNSFIDVTGTVFEGVRIYIGAYPFIVTEAIKEVTYRRVGATVVSGPLEERKEEKNR